MAYSTRSYDDHVLPHPCEWTNVSLHAERKRSCLENGSVWRDRHVEISGYLPFKIESATTLATRNLGWCGRPIWAQYRAYTCRRRSHQIDITTSVAGPMGCETSDFLLQEFLGRRKMVQLQSKTCRCLSRWLRHYPSSLRQ